MSDKPYAEREYGHTICMISRRAAGVWTNLPSISYALLLKLVAPRKILWVDLGLRYEMFNHFLINPSCFPLDSCVLGLLDGARFAKGITAGDLVSYAQAVLGDDTVTDKHGHPMSDIKGPDTAQYRECIKALSSKGYDIYMAPLQVPSLSTSGTGASLSTSMIRELLLILVESIRPVCTFLTLEGQPEARIFARKITEDQSVNQWLDASDIILTMVRFDSEERFNDSVSIPSIISRNTTWRERLKLVLTRVSMEPRVSSELEDHLLGCVPFADSVGESVNHGRIPLIDILCRGRNTKIGSDTDTYVKCINAIAERISDSLRLHRKPEGGTNNRNRETNTADGNCSGDQI